MGENPLRVWKLGDSVASVKTIPENGRGSYKHRNTLGGLAVRVECLQGMKCGHAAREFYSVETTLEESDKWVNNKTVDHYQGTHVEGQALGTARGPLAQV